MAIGKVSLPVAQKRSNKFDLSTTHITTQDFFQLRPVYIHECVPGEHISVDCSYFARLDPLIKPVYGNARVVNRAFFVPMRTIMSNWNEFITQTRPFSSVALMDKVPRVSIRTIVSVLARDPFAAQTTEEGFDFTYYGNNYKFTAIGQRAYKLLVSLGYRFSFADIDNSVRTVVSLLPLLAYLRIYYDYYRNKQFYYDNLDKYFSSFAWQSNARYQTEASSPDITSILNLVTYTMYENDYFTSAFVQPIVSGSEQNTSLEQNIKDYELQVDPSRESVVSNTDLNDGSITVPNLRFNEAAASESGNFGFTQYALDSLKALTNFMYRNSIAGARSLDRFLARYGKKLPDAVLNQSVYLGKSVSNIDIADVTSYADTGSTNAVLGQQAGKGISYSSNGSFDYSTDEFGYFMIVSVPEVDYGYYEGRPRMLQHITPLDFFTPEYDGLGMQPIRQDELFVNKMRSDDPRGFTVNTESNGNGIFGFQSRYAEYKCKQQDFLTGDFALPSRNTGLDAYHMLRTIYPDGGAVPRISYNFQRADGGQYDRIFNYTGDDYDHITSVFRFKVTSYLPMNRLFEDYNLENQHDQNGQRVEQNVHGQRF